MSLLQDFNRTQKGWWTTAGKDVQFRIEDDAEEIRCIFQQTVSESDWMFNFKAIPIMYKDAPVPFGCHAGFAALWHSVRDIVIGNIAKLYGTNVHRTVKVIGFSQGAALALLCYEDLAYGLKPLDLCGIGFGCPRVVIGDTIANRFPRFTRVAVRGDIVTELPPAIMGYRHMGKAEMLGPWSLPCPQKHEPAEYRKYLSGM